MGARTRGIANQILSGGLDATDGLTGAVSSSNITNASVTSVSSTPSIGGGFDKVASDPPSPVEGDIWYNTTSNTVKGYLFVADAWSSGGNLSTARSSHFGAGTQTAALVASGSPLNTNNSPVPTSGSTTEEGDGSTWTAGGSIPEERTSGGGAGTQTAAIKISGFFPGPAGGNPPTVQTYDGSTWSNTTGVPTGHGRGVGIGTQTAAFYVGGEIPGSPNDTDRVEEWNGSSWTAAPTINLGRMFLGGGGTTTASLIVGGYKENPPDPEVNNVEEYNGVSWSNVNVYPVAQRAMSGSGSQTAQHTWGGYDGTSNVAITNTYDGTSWTASANLATARQSSNCGGYSTPNAASIAAGGSDNSPAITNSTENFTQGGVGVKTLTSS